MRLTKHLVLFGAMLVTIGSQDAAGYILNGRWTSTATNGGGLVNGDPTTLTWSIVPDGTPSSAEGPSNLISFFDSIIGPGPGGSDLTQRPWFTYFEQAFDRWSQVSGLSYAYEPNDDGITHSVEGNAGILGVRGDVRIAGSLIDGNSGVLAFNFFPNNGDMTLDTGDVNIFGNPANNYRALRNILMHEHGHGIGLSHVESSNADFLMEPFLATSFDGPQLDDIRGAHRGYGDFFEKSNSGAGNDTAVLATPLGLINDGETATLGTAGSSTVIAPDETDFLSIDQNTDTDFFSFTIDSPATVDLTVTPQGTTFNQGPQGGTQSAFNTRTVSNLAIALFDSDQTTLLAQDNSGAAGQSDMISGFSLSQPGEYYVRITGDANNMQFYQLDVTVTEDNAVTGDFNGDGEFGCVDVDALVAEIVAGTNNAVYDMTGDGVVDTMDLDSWLAAAGAINLDSGASYLHGDADLDGTVDGNDFLIWNANKFNPTAAWCLADFNADGNTDGLDFLEWNKNKFTSADGVSAVPEPTSLLCAILAAAAAVCSRRAGRHPSWLIRRG